MERLRSDGIEWNF